MIDHGHHHIVIKNEAIVPGIKIVIGAAVIVIGSVITVNVLLPEMMVIDPRRNGVARNGRATKLVLILPNVMEVWAEMTVVGEGIEIMCDEKEIQFRTVMTMLVINIIVETGIDTTSSMNNIVMVIGWEKIILGCYVVVLHP